MAALLPDQVHKLAKEVLPVFSDGFQYTDLFVLTAVAMELVEQIGGMTNEEKHESAVAVIDSVIDSTDIRYVPDAMVDPLLKKGARALIPVLAKVAKGGWKIQTPPVA